MIKKHITTWLFIAASLLGNAQSELFEDAIVYNRQLYGGVQLHSNGFGLTGTYGRNKGAYKVWLYGLDIIFMKHEKETKSWNPFYNTDARSYLYGKTNNFYIVRPTFGRKRILTEKIRKGGVQVGYNWQFGPSLGLTKPVYLEIGYPDPPSYEYIQVEKFDANKHYIDNIYGRASGLKGLDELKLYPGGFFKIALNFEYANYKEGLKGIEAGLAVDAYANRIPIMSEEVLALEPDGAKNHQVFISLYINFFFGKKYNQD